MNRVLASARMQWVNVRSVNWVPLIVLLGAFVLSLVVYAAIPGNEAKVGGGLQAPLWFFITLGVQLLAFCFPFALSLGLTRKEFFLGFVILALVWGIAFASLVTVGGVVEKATHGWGMEGYFFYLSWMWDAGWVGAWLLVAATVWLFMFVGFAMAGLYKRWGMMFLVLVLLGMVLVLAAGCVVIARMDAWMNVFQWLTGLRAFDVAGVIVGLAVVVACAGWAVLRRMAIR